MQELQIKKPQQVQGPAVTIVIPTHQNLPNLKNCIQSIFETTSYPFKMILVESGSTDGTKEWLKTLQETYPEKIKVFNIKNIGSIGACEFGMKQADPKSDLYLTHDDCSFFPHRNWLWDYVYYSQKSDAGFITSCGLGRSGKEYKEGLIYVGSWDCYIPRRTIDKIGYPDINMTIGEELDYALRLQKAGLKIINFNDYQTIKHHQQRTSPHSIDDEAKKRKNEEYFRHKHNLL